MSIKNNTVNPSDYPFNQFPESYQNFMRELHRQTQAPMAMIGSSMLCGVSLVLQNIADVRRPNGLEPSPISLIGLTLAVSGERKSTVDNVILHTIHEFEKSQAEKIKQDLIEYESSLLGWEIESKALVIKMKTLAVSVLYAEDKDIAEIREDSVQCGERLKSHRATKPKKPIALRLLYNNSTIEALLYGLHTNLPSAGIVSDEGNTILNGRISADLASLNSLWSGSTLHVDRRGSESYVLSDARLTIGVMVQPEALDKFLDGKGDGARDLGFLARCLVAYPVSTQGGRFIQNQTQTWEHRAAFEVRMKDFLDQNLLRVGEGKIGRQIVEFSIEAQLRWVAAFNNIEAALAPGGWLADINDYASKIAESIARIAANFHVFSGFEGAVSLDTMNRAIAVAHWYAEEFKRLFAPAPEMPRDQSDAHLLELWLADYFYRNNGARYLKKNDIRQFGPNQLRNKSRLDAALFILSCERRAWIVKDRKTTLVELNMQYFHDFVNFNLHQQGCLPNRLPHRIC